MENFLSSLGFDVITTIVSAFIIFLCRNFIMITLSYIINLFSTDDVNINGLNSNRQCNSVEFIVS